MTTVAVLQPGYLPWLGFFDQMIRSDVFVYYDDVQFDKNGWRNRNRVKSMTGPLWLTVPVLSAQKFGQLILETKIDNRQPWARKQLGTIRQLYARAPYLAPYLPGLEEVLCAKWQYLVDLDIALVELICGWMGLKRQAVRSSKLGVVGERSERLLRICRHFGAEKYLSGDSAQCYLDVPAFEAHKIAVEWQRYSHPTYPQLHGEFLPYLSAIDLVFNVGGDRSLELLSYREETR